MVSKPITQIISILTMRILIISMMIWFYCLQQWYCIFLGTIIYFVWYIILGSMIMCVTMVEWLLDYMVEYLTILLMISTLNYKDSDRFIRDIYRFIFMDLCASHIHTNMIIYIYMMNHGTYCIYFWYIPINLYLFFWIYPL